MAAILNPHAGSDIGLLSINGIDLTCAFEDATWSVESTDVDASSVCQEGEMNQTMGKQATISGRFYGDSATGYRTNYLDFGAITIGGTDIKPQLYDLTLSGGFARQDLPAASMGMASGILRRNFSGSVQMLFDDTQVAQSLVVAAASMNGNDALAQLVLVLSGKTISLPIKLRSPSLPITKGDYQKVTVQFTGQAPNRGVAYPTAPTTLPSTPGLLDLALLSPRSRMAFDFISKSSYGIRSNGFCKFGDFSFNYTTRGLTYFNYQFLSDGDFNTVLRGQ